MCHRRPDERAAVLVHRHRDERRRDRTEQPPDGLAHARNRDRWVPAVADPEAVRGLAAQLRHHRRRPTTTLRAPPAGTTRAIPIAGRLGLTTDAHNVVLSVVAVSPTNNGYLTIYPCGTPMPSTSSLNFTKGINLANTVITTLGTTAGNTGKVCVYTSVKTDLIIDTTGTLTPTAFDALPTPQRFVDSRLSFGTTDDGQQQRFGPLPAGTTRAIPIAGRLGLTTDAHNVVLSVVAVSPTNNGYLTIYPCGTPMPSTSSLNFTKGINLANTVITTLGTTAGNTGKVCVYTSVKTDLIIDTTGTLTPTAFDALPTPQRFVDSRLSFGTTDDGQQQRFGPLPAGTTRAIPIAGRLGLTTDAHNVVLSVVAVSPTNNGYPPSTPAAPPCPPPAASTSPRASTSPTPSSPPSAPPPATPARSASTPASRPTSSSTPPAPSPDHHRPSPQRRPSQLADRHRDRHGGGTPDGDRSIARCGWPRPARRPPLPARRARPGPPRSPSPSGRPARAGRRAAGAGRPSENADGGGGGRPARAAPWRSPVSPSSSRAWAAERVGRR